MALYLVATPIGNMDDISLRALKCLQNCPIVICEEPKRGKQILSYYKVGRKELYKLNEHTSSEEVQEMAKLCKESQVALMSDCGTPGFCDPGSELVKAAREHKIPVISLPGASSLMCLLSLSSQRIDSFEFVGFLPANKEKRQSAWAQIKKERKKALVFLETPYRLKQWQQEIQEHLGDRKILLGVNLSGENEILIECMAKDLKRRSLPEKAEPILLVYPLSCSL